MNGTPYQPLRVAAATENGITSDVRFRDLKILYIYEYDEAKECFVFLEERCAPDTENKSGKEAPEEAKSRAAGNDCHTGGCGSGNGNGCEDEEYMKALSGTLHDCSYLLLEKIGPRPSRILLREGISVLERGGEIDGSLLLLSKYVSVRRRTKAQTKFDSVLEEKEE